MIEAGFSFEQIRKITWHQYMAVLRHPRDSETGLLKPRWESDGRPELSDKDRLFRDWQHIWGLTAKECETKWEEMRETETFKAALDCQDLPPDEYDRRLMDHRRLLRLRRRPGRLT